VALIFTGISFNGYCNSFVLAIKKQRNVKTKLLFCQRCVWFIYSVLIVDSMSRVTFGNSAPATIKHTHILQLFSGNSIKFVSKKNKLIFITWKEMSLSQNHRIFS